MARKRYSPPKANTSTFGLNITSMTDMFTILLVFLLQSYSTADVQVNPITGIDLPISNAEVNPVKSIEIALSKKALIYDGKEIATMDQNGFAAKDLDPNDPNFILPLFKQLDQIAQGQKEKKEVKEGRILLQADSSLPYSVIRKVMYTASMAGFPQLKMATVVGN